MPGLPSPVLLILRGLGCLEPQVTKSHRNPVKTVQVLWKIELGSVGSSAGRRGEENKRKKK